MTTYWSIDTWWWPYVFVFIAGFIATNVWRWLGVYLVGNLDPNAEILNWVRAVATALIAGVIAKLILFPSGALADVHLSIRLFSLAAGFVAYLIAKQNMVIGIGVALGVLIGSTLSFAPLP